MNTRKPMEWTDIIFNLIILTTFGVGIFSCYESRLSSYRPLFFGVFVGSIVHRFMGGIEKGEITDFKSVVLNGKLQGSLASILLTIGVLESFASLHGHKKISFETKPPEAKPIVFDHQKGVNITLLANIDGNIETENKIPGDKSYPDLFSYFADKCYVKVNKTEGCKTKFKFITDNRLVQGEAQTCFGEFNNLPILISSNKAQPSILPLGVPVKLSTPKICTSNSKVIVISSKDAELACIERGGDGNVLPFLGDPKLPKDSSEKSKRASQNCQIE